MLTDGAMKMLRTFSKRANYPGTVTDENAKEIITSLAVNRPEFLAEQFERAYNLAVRFYDGINNDNWARISGNADELMELLDIKTDYPGLYPTYELDRNNKHLTEYSPLNAIRQYNNYWNHW